MKNRKRNTIISILAIAALMGFALAMTSCKKAGPKPGEPGTAGAKKIIGVSLLKENDAFYVSMKDGIIKAAKEMGYEVEVLSADNDEQKQDNNVDALLLKNISALIICPVNSKGVSSIIAKANAKNIPVFTADIAAENSKVVAHIASDNYQGGQIGAETLIKNIGKSGKVAIIQIPGTESVASRVAGFVDTAKKNGLTIIEPYLNGKDDTQESERAAGSAILSNPDLKGIFTANDNMAFGAESAIKASGKNIILIGFNAEPAAVKKIKEDGIWKADVIQYPDKIGEKTVETIDKFFKGEIKDTGKTQFIPVEVGIVDANTK